ncbi:MAG: hypothetical protein WA817_01500, partial [Candidatus Acidiferrum sp.]
MSGGKRIRDHWKIPAGIVCGVILLAGVAAGSHWDRAVKADDPSLLATTLAARARVAQSSFTFSPTLASTPPTISHPTKLTPAPASATFALRHAAAPSPSLSPVARAQAMKVFAGLPMMFEANNGQTDPR